MKFGYDIRKFCKKHGYAKIFKVEKKYKKFPVMRRFESLTVELKVLSRYFYINLIFFSFRKHLIYSGTLKDLWEKIKNDLKEPILDDTRHRHAVFIYYYSWARHSCEKGIKLGIGYTALDGKKATDYINVLVNPSLWICETFKLFLLL